MPKPFRCICSLKIRANGFVERLGTSRRYRLTPLGLKLGVLLVKLRTRLPEPPS